MRPIILLCVLFLLGCAQDVTLVDEDEIFAILHTEKELEGFLSTQVTIAEQVYLTESDLAALQQQQDGFGEWYRQVPQGKYLRVIIVNEQGTSFIALIDPTAKRVTKILGLINVSLS
ncbi:hypothetical protein HY639_03915 [Candidatus Woesearchaeota archaeon]|nr:hypothetical protein [Candidatus Woesearchaeota archaeon]